MSSNATENKSIALPYLHLYLLFQVSNSAKLIGECEVTLPLLSYVIGDVLLSTSAIFEMATGTHRLVKLSIGIVIDSITGGETTLVYAGTADGKVFVVSVYTKRLRIKNSNERSI